MRILVTGAAGFIAYHLINKLIESGHIVVGIDNFISGQESNITELKEKFQGRFLFISADINDLTPSAIDTTAKWSEILNPGPYATGNSETRFDRIYHLACPASPPIYQRDMLHTLDTCYLGSRNVFNIATKHKARILIASTSEIYGDPEVHPQPEDYRGNVNTMGIRSCYDEGKRAMETLGFIYRERMGIEVRTARIFNTYGPRMNPHDGRVLTNFITQALRGEPLTVYGDGTQTRSFCYVDDLVSGLAMLMESVVSEPINLGAQYEFTIREIAQKVIQQINPELKIAEQPLPKDDPKVRRPNSSKAKELLGWQPTVSLESGISQMISDLRGRELQIALPNLSKYSH